MRELPVIAGWVGCGVWDAAVLMARFLIHDGETGSFLKGLRVLELGSGVGVVGLVAALFASETVLTDYSTAILDNLEYNVWINSCDLTADRLSDLFPGAARAQRRFEADGMRLRAARVAYLDWFKPELAEKPSDDMEPTHDRRLPPGGFRCTVSGGSSLGKFPVILGSELTYQMPGVKELAHVVETFLAPGGVFMEIISVYRGPGPRAFMRLMRDRGWRVEAREVTHELTVGLDSQQSRSRNEKYIFWTLFRSWEVPAHWPDFPRLGSSALIDNWDDPSLDCMSAATEEHP